MYNIRYITKVKGDQGDEAYMKTFTNVKEGQNYDDMSDMYMRGH